jgi:hypothetical protein
VCRQNRWPVTDREHRIRLLIDACGNCCSESVRLVQKPHCDRVIGPGIIELIAPVGRQHERRADALGSVAERPNLIARRRREKKNALHT